MLVRGPSTRARNCMMVCNHMSYLDMIVLASIAPSVFVTSVDMGEIFFLGTMAEVGGALFIERRHRQRIDHDIAQIRRTLEDGLDVTLFPEGTSGNGDGILPFKKSLLTAALEAGVPVLPVTLKYYEIEGESFSQANHEAVCWYGRARFFPHFFKLLSLKSIRAKIVYGSPVKNQPGMTRESLSDDLYRAISSEYSALGV